MFTEEWIAMFNREIIARRGALTVAFAVIAILMLVLGWFYKPKFESSVTIFADNQNVIAPILEGATAQTQVADSEAIAREIIFSRDIVDDVIVTNGLAKDVNNPTQMELARIDLYRQTTVSNLGSNLTMVSYKDVDPVRAYRVTKQFGDRYVERSVREQTRESNDAFEFIENQVDIYRRKLAASEARLREFRTRFGEGVAANAVDIDEELIELRRNIDITQLELSEAEARRASLARQLQSESVTAVKDFRESQFQQQIAGMQNEIDRLRLDYTDTYPDIVRLKQQIADLRQLAANERETRLSDEQVQEQSSINPVYQRLRQQLSGAETAVSSLRARLQQQRALFVKERERAASSNEFGAKLADLQRDYQVDQEIYQEMLRRRESARVSMNLDEKRQGSAVKIQEPAQLPNLPKGLRFLHFGIVGPILAILLPLGALFGLLYLDPKLRLPSALQNNLGLPVLAVVPHARVKGEIGNILTSPLILGSVIAGVIVVYMLAGWIRWTGGIL
ncbi:MAG: XrtA system polysaccharide chain length determinant [Pseudomonadota bacterium]